MVEAQLVSQKCLARVAAGESLTKIFPEELSELTTSSDSPLVKNTVFGALRWQGYLHFSIDRLVKRRPPHCFFLLQVGIFMLEYSRAASHAVVNSAVKVAKEIDGEQSGGFVNAVLRNYLRRRDEIKKQVKNSDEAIFQHQGWWIKKLQNQHPKFAETILNSAQQHPPFTLRVNRRKAEVEDYERRLGEKGLQAQRVALDYADTALILGKPVNVAILPGFKDGVVSVQDAGAQTTAHRMDLKDGQRVLDACAAPGGKASHILELANVQLWALDIDADRLNRVRENLHRLGQSAQTLQADASDVDSWWDGKPFDRVLVDAPCSASGITRRHPDIKWLRRKDDVERFVRQQRALMSAMWKVLAKGGKLLYVTCSIFKEENEDQAKWFLGSNKDAVLIQNDLNTFGEQMLPDVEHDGFFHALFKKN